MIVWLQKSQAFFGLLILISLVAPVPGKSVDLPITVTETHLQSPDVCSGTFVAHPLDHTTTVPGGDTVRMFEANGSGVAINDLDNDGQLDILLGNHAGNNTLLWNQGNLQFQREEMIHGDTRSLTIIDLDADGWMDMVLTRRASAPNYWRNKGQRRFEREVLPGISQPLYSINWADFDRDGDLDLIGATYDAGLLSDLGQNFLMSGLSGVYYYENRGEVFRPTRLAGQAQGLALVTMDLNQDGWLDFIVGNDFGLPDMAWAWTSDGWQPISPFSATTYSTMSLDTGDIDNDGSIELFAADMKPYDSHPDTQAAWAQVIQSLLSDPLPEDDPQIMANVLQVSDRTVYHNRAPDSGVDATGWSWSSKFGDLDQDGYLDLYVVNGMIEQTIFAQLPEHELVEANQVFRNDSQGKFTPISTWGLNDPASGRGMSMGDLDNDGDLDIVVNNLRAPAVLFENQLCIGSSLTVDLYWNNSLNARAVGAELVLHTDTENYYRNVKVSSGYLSGDPVQVHFGIPENRRLNRLVIVWPDGATSTLETLSTNSHLSIIRR